MNSDYREYLRQLRGNGVSRRRFVAGAATVGFGAAAAGIVGCSSNNKNNTAGNTDTVVKPPTAITPAANSTVAGSAAATRAGTPAAPAAASRTSTPAALDSTKGKPGGTLKYMLSGSPGGLAIIDTPSSFNQVGHCFSALLARRWGQASVPYTDFSLEPDLAQAMPEQPDDTTYVYKLRQAKFHDGRALTAQDVQYSFDRYTNYAKSTTATQWQAWYDHTETPDPQTVVVKTKVPFADALEVVAGDVDGYILEKEHEEGPDGLTKPLGSGPYVFADAQLPISITLKKNPDYYLKPYPYFDQLQMYGAADAVTGMTNFITKQVHMTWIVYINDRDQILKQRPDAKVINIEPYSGASLRMRTDKPPFNDARVRQALSLAIDRTAIKNTVNQGKGENDQFFALMYQDLFGTSKVAGLGDAAKYWNYDPQAAKQLLAAAGIDKPIESQMNHYDASVIGQQFPDTATLIQAQWKQLGIANIKDNSQAATAYSSTTNLGQYDGFDVSIKTGIQQGIQHGTVIRAATFWGPNGEHSPRNNSYINDPQLSALADKQFKQLKADDQKQTYRQMETIMAAQQYIIELTTSAQYWPYDPSLANLNMSGEQVTRRYAMRWWFA